MSPQAVSIFAKSCVVGCIKYQHNSLEEKVEKIAVATSYEAGWIDDTLQDIHGQKI